MDEIRLCSTGGMIVTSETEVFKQKPVDCHAITNRTLIGLEMIPRLIHGTAEQINPLTPNDL
jgi:hypothetical protein